MILMSLGFRVYQDFALFLVTVEIWDVLQNLLNRITPNLKLGYLLNLKPAQWKNGARATFCIT